MEKIIVGLYYFIYQHVVIVQEQKKKYQKYINYNKTKIRFAEIEIQDNIMTNVRFNVSGVPFIYCFSRKKFNV